MQCSICTANLPCTQQIRICNKWTSGAMRGRNSRLMNVSFNAWSTNWWGQRFSSSSSSMRAGSFLPRYVRLGISHYSGYYFAPDVLLTDRSNSWGSKRHCKESSVLFENCNYHCSCTNAGVSSILLIVFQYKHSMWIVVFLAMTPYSVVGFVNVSDESVAECSSEILVTSYQITRYHISEVPVYRAWNSSPDIKSSFCNYPKSPPAQTMAFDCLSKSGSANLCLILTFSEIWGDQAVTVKNTNSWYVTPCSRAGVYRLSLGKLVN
jgi:hypothetical protein